VNHATCDQFWLEDTDTEELNLPPVISVSRLSKFSHRSSGEMFF
jgi:hypothetical protein